MPKRKVILNLCTSLDSYIEGANGEIDWCLTDQDYSMTEFLNQIDTIFFGRISYEQLIREMPNAFDDKQRIVFSKTLKSNTKASRVISENIGVEVEEILQEPGKDIWLFGGASLTTDMLNLNLVDELIISVHPLILGGGLPLFKEVASRIRLTLMNTKTFSTGLVQLYYKVEK